jgi:hypothetical protein
MARRDVDPVQELSDRLNLLYRDAEQAAADRERERNEFRAAIQALEQQIADQNVRLAQAGPVQGPLPQHLGRPAEEDYRMRFIPYTGEGKDPIGDYEVFERNVRHVIDAMGYRFPHVCPVILGSIRGEAAKLVTEEISANFNQFLNLEDFLTHLRSLFVPSSHKEAAMAEYLHRTQQPKEPLLRYYTNLRMLFMRSHAAHERAESSFIRQFISGIESIDIQKELIRRERTFNTGRLALDAALAEESIVNIIKTSAYRRQQCPLTTHVTSSEQSEVTPMEIGNLSYRGRRTNRQNHQGARQQNRQQKHKQGHDRRPKDKNYKPKATDSKPKPKAAKDECLECHGKGHWANECPTKTKRLASQKKKTNGLNNQKGNRHTPMEVGNIHKPPPDYEEISSETKNA